MKKMILCLCLMVVGATLSAQESAIEQLFDRYSGQDGYTSIHLTSYMFDLFSKIADEDEDKEFKSVSSKLEAIKILTVDSAVNVKRKTSFYQELTTSIKAPDYKDLMVVKDGQEEIKFLIKEANDSISELVMIVGGDKDGVLISLLGDIQLKEISKLSKSMDIKGLEHLDKIEEE